MISPVHVVHQVLEGRAPKNWLVLRPGPLVSPVLFIIFISYIVFFVLFIIYCSLDSHQEDAGPFWQLLVIIPIVLFSLAIIVLASIRFTKNYKRKRDSVLILLPEGVVSCEYLSDESKRTCNVIEYADVSHISVNEYSTQYRDYTSLVLQYQDGRLERWRIDYSYGPPLSMAERVIQSHRRFVTAHAG